MISYSEYLARLFPGVKVQKISLNAGHACPNRDGTIGYGGCIYCRNEAFSPSYCHAGATLAEQLRAGKRFFARKYPGMKYLAYFQNYTNTYAPLPELCRQYEEMLAEDDVVGLVVGTRPDCLDEECVAMMASLPRPVIVELGAESSHDSTLRLVNRGHTWADTCRATHCLYEAGLHCGLHLIAGLPGENEEMILATVRRACALPVQTLKLHHLQVLRGTELERLIAQGQLSVPRFTVDEYLALCRRIIAIVPPDMCIERFLAQAPPGMVVSPKWGIKNYQFMHLLQGPKMSKPTK